MTRVTVRQHVHAPLADTFDRFVDISRYPDPIRTAHAVQTDTDNPHAVWFRYHLAGITRQFCIIMTVHRDQSTITWRSVAGPGHTGTAHFRAMNPHSCTVTLQLELHTHHPIDTMGTVLGLARTHLEHELHRFAAHVEHDTGHRLASHTPDHRAPSEKLFDTIFPTDQRRKHP